MPFYWCPRCGTIKPCDMEATAPVLPERCRRFIEKIRSSPGIVAAAAAIDAWVSSGADEASALPAARADSGARPG